MSNERKLEEEAQRQPDLLVSLANKRNNPPIKSITGTFLGETLTIKGAPAALNRIMTHMGSLFDHISKRFDNDYVDEEPLTLDGHRPKQYLRQAMEAPEVPEYRWDLASPNRILRICPKKWYTIRMIGPANEVNYHWKTTTESGQHLREKCIGGEGCKLRHLERKEQVVLDLDRKQVLTMNVPRSLSKVFDALKAVNHGVPINDIEHGAVVKILWDWKKPPGEQYEVRIWSSNISAQESAGRIWDSSTLKDNFDDCPEQSATCTLGRQTCQHTPVATGMKVSWCSLCNADMVDSPTGYKVK